MVDKKGIGFKIDATEHDTWKDAAKRDGRSLNAFIRNAVRLEVSRLEAKLERTRKELGLEEL